MKITRWRGGIKDGNRRERDMTDSSFNEEFVISQKGVTLDETVGNWRVRHKEQTDLTDNADSLGFERYENTDWSQRADVSESIDTDDIEIVQRGRGMFYSSGTDPTEVNTRFRMLRNSEREESGIIVGNPLGTVNTHSATPPKCFKPQGFFWSDRTPGASDTTTLSEIDIMVPTTTTAFFKDLAFTFNTAGVPYRAAIYNEEDILLFESQSEYSWNLGVELNITQTGGLTVMEASDAFYIEEGELVRFMWQFKSPVEVVGIDNFMGQGFFVPALSALISLVDIDEYAFLDQLHESEYALASAHEDHSLHLKDCEILTDDEKEVILWTSRRDGQDIGESEWAVVNLEDTQPNTLHLSNLEILTDPFGIPLVFEN